MSQFSIHRNRNEATRNRFPLLLAVQSDLLEPLHTRVVVPLSLVTSAKTRKMEQLTPKLTVAGKDYLMVTPQVTSIAVDELGAVVATASRERAHIMAALGLLLTGLSMVSGGTKRPE